MLNLARWLAPSRANGPGERFVLWVQGCPLACPGCWNPDTWGFSPRELHSTDALLALITATPGIDGVTFTGGEPFAQAPALAVLAREVQALRLSVFVFTGYTMTELQMEGATALLAQTDVLVSGRYVERLRANGLPWRGSSNQRVWFISDRYSPEDLTEVVTEEIWLDPMGGGVMTGFPLLDRST